jgi:hypothetical protein
MKLLSKVELGQLLFSGNAGRASTIMKSTPTSPGITLPRSRLTIGADGGVAQQPAPRQATKPA